MLPRYTSSELFHFVGSQHPHDDERNCATLASVLRSGWISAPPHLPSWEPERVTLNLEGNLADGDLIVPEVTCFADIPREGLRVHCQKYGKFGVSLSRSYLASYGVRPVMYFPFDPSDTHCGANGMGRIEYIERAFRSSLEIKEPGPVGHVLTSEFLAFVKPFNYTLGFDDPRNFYLEREWRRLGNVRITSDALTSIVVAPGFEERLRELVPEVAEKVAELHLEPHTADESPGPN